MAHIGFVTLYKIISPQKQRQNLQKKKDLGVKGLAKAVNNATNIMNCGHFSKNGCYPTLELSKSNFT